MKSRFETGLTLISILIFLLIFAWLSLHIMGQGNLTIKISESFQDHLKTRVAIENRLIREESDILKTPDNHLAKKQGFVADHLSFNCTEGVDIFKAKAGPLQSTLAVRSREAQVSSFIAKRAASSEAILALREDSGELRLQTLAPKQFAGVNMLRLESVAISSPYSKSFERLAGYSEFQQKYQHRPLQVFEIFVTADHKTAMLIKSAGKNLPEIEWVVLPIPVSEGFLAVSEVKFKEEWRTFLLLAATDSKSKKSLLWVLDVTEANAPLKPFLSFNEPQIGLITARPIWIQIEEKGFGIAIASQQGQNAVLQLLFLERPWFPLQVPLGELALKELVAIDLHQRGQVDRFYVLDETHLWAIDFKNSQQLCAEKLMSVEAQSLPIVIQNAERAGVRLYLLGKTAQGKGLYTVEDPLLTGSVTFSLLSAGEYAAVMIRFGQLFLVPKQSNQDPIILALPNHTHVPAVWQDKFFGVSTVSDGIVDERLLTKLLWDHVLQQEILFYLNASYQLKMQVVQERSRKYGRMGWQKLVE